MLIIKGALLIIVIDFTFTLVKPQRFHMKSAACQKLYVRTHHKGTPARVTITNVQWPLIQPQAAFMFAAWVRQVSLLNTAYSFDHRTRALIIMALKIRTLDAVSETHITPSMPRAGSPTYLNLWACIIEHHNVAFYYIMPWYTLSLLCANAFLVVPSGWNEPATGWKYE